MFYKHNYFLVPWRQVHKYRKDDFSPDRPLHELFQPLRLAPLRQHRFLPDFINRRPQRDFFDFRRNHLNRPHLHRRNPCHNHRNALERRKLPSFNRLPARPHPLDSPDNQTRLHPLQLRLEQHRPVPAENRLQGSRHLRKKHLLLPEGPLNHLDSLRRNPCRRQRAGRHSCKYLLSNAGVRRN